jgi:hypothetical protein
MLDLMVECHERISSVELPEDLQGFSFKLLTEFGVVFLVHLSSLKIKI